MNLRQQRFVTAYVKDPNATKAAEKAGFAQPQSQGPRLLKNVEVQQAIEKQARDAATAAGLTPEYVLARLMAVAEEAFRAKAYGASTAAYRELGRHLQLFTDRLDITGLHAQAAVLADEHGVDADEIVRGAMKLLTPPK